MLNVEVAIEERDQRFRSQECDENQPSVDVVIVVPMDEPTVRLVMIVDDTIRERWFSTQVIHGCPEPVGSVCVAEISLRTYSVKRFANRYLQIPTRLDWKSTEFRREFPLSFRLESVGKEMVGIRRNRQESTKNASDPTQLLTDPAIGMLDLGRNENLMWTNVDSTACSLGLSLT